MQFESQRRRDPEGERRATENEKLNHLLRTYVTLTQHTGYMNALRIGTSILVWVSIVLVFLTTTQLHEAWTDDHTWSLPDHHGWETHVHWAVNLSAALASDDPESLETLSAYIVHHDADDEGDEVVGDHDFFDPLHHSHPDSVARVLKSHWQWGYLTVALGLNCTFVLSWLVRMLFLHRRQSFFSVLHTANFLFLAAIAQFFATVLRLYVACYTGTAVAFTTLALNAFLILLELVNTFELFIVRDLYVFLKGTRDILSPKEVTEAMVNNNLLDEETVKRLKPMFSSPESFLEVLIDCLSTASDNLHAYASGKFGKKKKVKVF